MPKFAAFLKGGSARKRISVLGRDNVTLVECDVKLLTCGDDAAIEEAAVEYARAHKVADPKPGNSQYERGLMLATLARACLDYEVADKEDPFFPGGAAEVEQQLDDGRAALLFFQQRAFQQETSPNPKKGQDPVEYLALLYEAIEAKEQGDPARPFVGLPYGTLVNFSMESARLLSSLRLLPSESGSSSPSGSASS